jgi:hypothetical protein
MDVYRKKRVIFPYLVYKMYILKKKRDTGCRTVMASWGSATQNARKMDVRRRNVAGGMCAVPHPTYTIPDRNSGDARLKKRMCAPTLSVA